MSKSSLPVMSHTFDVLVRKANKRGFKKKSLRSQLVLTVSSLCLFEHIKNITH